MTSAAKPDTKTDSGRVEHNADVVLRDGSTVRVRPVGTDDEPRLVAFLRGLSAQSRQQRYFAALGDDQLALEARRQSRVDHARTFGLVATVGHEERVVGHAEYDVMPNDRAEVGFAIADEYQGQGLGTILLGQLAQVASAHGIVVFEATVLPANYQMLGVFRESGFPVTVTPAPSEIGVEFPIELTPDALARYEQREGTGAVNSLRAFFRPASVAVIGASRQRGTIGGEVLHNLLSYGFNGPVFPVNPKAPFVQSVVSYPSVEDIQGHVDLAVITVPVEAVLQVAESCGRKGVRALVVISAGFGETGAEGRVWQDAMLRI